METYFGSKLQNQIQCMKHYGVDEERIIKMKNYNQWLHLKMK